MTARAHCDAGSIISRAALLAVAARSASPRCPCARCACRAVACRAGAPPRAARSPLLRRSRDRGPAFRAAQLAPRRRSRARREQQQAARSRPRPRCTATRRARCSPSRRCRSAYYILGSGLYKGEPFSYLWPFSQALAATVSMANVPRRMPRCDSFAHELQSAPGRPALLPRHRPTRARPKALHEHAARPSTAPWRRRPAPAGRSTTTTTTGSGSS